MPRNSRENMDKWGCTQADHESIFHGHKMITTLINTQLILTRDIVWILVEKYKEGMVKESTFLPQQRKWMIRMNFGVNAKISYQQTKNFLHGAIMKPQANFI